MGQKYAAYNETGAIVAYYDSVESPIPSDVTRYIEITDDEHLAASSSHLYSVVNGELIAPTTQQVAAVQSALEWGAYQAQAQLLLDKTDVVCLRCYKAGVAYPEEWQKYTADLRAIVSAKSGDPAASLPPIPPYPAGT